MASGDGLMDLDRLIQSCEFENQQYVKLIEKENQQIEALEKEIEEKGQETLKLEEAITQLDEDTKRAHKQFTLNRDNCESLRKTAVVLMEHEVALNRKLNSIIDHGEKERQEHTGILQHYESIYTDYMAKYKKFPFADEIEALQKELNAGEQVVNEVEERINKLKLQVDEKQGGSDGNFKDLNKFITKIAEIKVDTHRAVAEKNQFENELREIQSKNSRNEDEEICMESNSLAVSTPEQSNISVNDSLGEDMSTMIGIFHNKQDASQVVQTCKKTDLATTTISSPNMQVSTEIPDTRGAVSEIPITKMAEMDIRQSVPASPKSRMINSIEIETSFIESPAPMETESSVQRTVTSTQGNLNSAPVLGHRGVPSTFVPSQSPSIRMPVIPTLVPRSPAMQPRTRAMSLVPSLNRSQTSPNSQDVMMQSSGGTPILSSSTLNRPSPSNSISPQPDPRLTPKIKHGVNAIQTRPLNQAAAPRTPTLIMPTLEPRKDHVPSPRLPVIQSRAPPRLSLPPPPLQTPDAYRGLDPSRFVSPVQPPPSRYQATQSPSPRQLFVTPVSAPTVRTTASATATVSSHFHKLDPEPESVSHKDVSMEDSGKTKSNPGTPKTPKTPKTPTEEKSQSPFNIEKHLEAIKMLSTSPGCPLYAQRPMFEEAQAGESSPGPFLQSFTIKATNEAAIFSTPTSKSTPKENKSGSREVQSLFAGMATDDAPMEETSFNLGGMRNSPARGQGSFLSIFASGDFKSPPNSKSSPQDNFSFSFGQDATPKSTQSDFAFSFGGNSDMDERSPSVFNLF